MTGTPAEEYEFTAYHEAGHVVAVERTPGQYVLRTYFVDIYFDEEWNRFDGTSAFSSYGLTDKQELFHSLAGRVAELMARSMGHWDVTAVQARMRSGEFGDAQDTQEVNALLIRIAPEGNCADILAASVLAVYNFLATNWDAVTMVAHDVLNACDAITHTGRVDINQFSAATQERLWRLAHG